MKRNVRLNLRQTNAEIEQVLSFIADEFVRLIISAQDNRASILYVVTEIDAW